MNQFLTLKYTCFKYPQVRILPLVLGVELGLAGMLAYRLTKLAFQINLSPLRSTNLTPNKGAPPRTCTRRLTLFNYLKLPVKVLILQCQKILQLVLLLELKINLNQSVALTLGWHLVNRMS